MIASTWSGVITASPVSMSAGAKPMFFFEINLHHRQESLFVRLLVDLDLDITGFHHFEHLRHQIEAAEENLARRNIAVLKNLGHSRHARIPYRNRRWYRGAHLDKRRRDPRRWRDRYRSRSYRWSPGGPGSPF